MTRVLSVEDEPETIDGQLDMLEDGGCVVDRTNTRNIAEDRLRQRTYRVIVLDQRFGRNVINFHEGTELIEDVKAGRFGAGNAAAYFVFITAYRDDVDEQRLRELPGFLGVLSKGSGVTRRLRALVHEVAPLTFGDDMPRAAFPVLLEIDELVVDSDGERIARGRVPAWDPRRVVEIDTLILPPAVNEELKAGTWPVYVSCTVNLEAEIPEDLDPSTFELLARMGDDE